MTIEEIIIVLEGLKDHINDDGKRELSMVQKVLLSFVVPNPFEEKATVTISNIPEEPSREEPAIKKTKVKAKPKAKKKR